VAAGGGGSRPKGEHSVAAPEFRGASLILQALQEPEVMIAGPAETGKTWSACWYVDSFLRRYPGAQGALLRKVRSSLYGSVLQTFRRVAALRGGVRAFGGAYPSWLDYQNGSRLWLGGLDDPQKVLSSERDIIYINQAEELEAAAWETVRTRVTGRGAVAPYTVLLGDCNPGAGDHWILRRAKAGSLRLLESRHEDNPTLFTASGEITAQGVISLRALDGLTGVRYQRLRLGKWVGAEGQFFEMWDERRHTRTIDRPVPPDWRVWAAFDYGYQHNAAFGILALDTQGTLYLLGEYVTRRELVPELVTGFHDLLQALQIPKGRLWKCVAGHDIFQARGGDDLEKISDKFARLGWVFTKAQVERVTGAQDLLTRIGNPEKGVPSTLVIDSRCVRTITAIPKMVADPHRPEDIKKVDADPLDGSGGDDAIDMLRYGAMEAPAPVPVIVSAAVVAGLGVKGWMPGARR
jgi:hypothetical protein